MRDAEPGADTPTLKENRRYQMPLLPRLVPQWPVLNGLLDQALDLAPDARERWLADLAAEHQAVRSILRQLLDVQCGIESGAFLDRLPKVA